MLPALFKIKEGYLMDKLLTREQQARVFAYAQILGKGRVALFKNKGNTTILWEGITADYTIRTAEDVKMVLGAAGYSYIIERGKK